MATLRVWKNNWTGQRKYAAGAERLYKIGVLAKAEVEQRALKVARLASDFANAQLVRAKNDLAAQESQLAAGEGTKDELEAAKAAVAQLTEAAQIAAANASAQSSTQRKQIYAGSKSSFVSAARKNPTSRALRKNSPSLKRRRISQVEILRSG